MAHPTCCSAQSPLPSASCPAVDWHAKCFAMPRMIQTL